MDYRRLDRSAKACRRLGSGALGLRRLSGLVRFRSRILALDEMGTGVRRSVQLNEKIKVEDGLSKDAPGRGTV